MKIAGQSRPANDGSLVETADSWRLVPVELSGKEVQL